jgi:hypothetical protein
MAPRPQNSLRGSFTKQWLVIPTGSTHGIIFSDYNPTTPLIKGNSTGIVVNGRVKVNNAQTIGANSTGFILSSQTTKPATRTAAKIALITNSTGVTALAVNTTGQTWKYFNVTSVIPT